MMYDTHFDGVFDNRDHLGVVAVGRLLLFRKPVTYRLPLFPEIGFDETTGCSQPAKIIERRQQ